MTAYTEECEFTYLRFCLPRAEPLNQRRIPAGDRRPQLLSSRTPTPLGLAEKSET